mmetsp:Transcript_33224/g.105713  ORF Transcript_33224/g.105713 Transcript_33224/m.105713 type:complete len:226 (+) Transcript_33224:412-1089(+)
MAGAADVAAAAAATEIAAAAALAAAAAAAAPAAASLAAAAAAAVPLRPRRRRRRLERLLGLGTGGLRSLLGPLGPLGAGAGVDARRGREVQGRLGRRRYYRPGCGCRRRCHGNVAWREIQGKRHFEGQYFGGHDELDSRVLRWCPQVVERVDLDSAGIGRGFRSGRGGSGGRLGGRRLKARWLGRCCPAPVCRGGLGWRRRGACRRQQLERDRRVLRTRRLLGAA